MDITGGERALFCLVQYWVTNTFTFTHTVCSVSSVAHSCPTLCNPMDCSTPRFPVHHQLPELAQTPAHQVSDAIQPSHPLSSPSTPAFNLAQHQGLFQWVSSSHQVAKALEFQLQHQSFQWNSGLISFRIDWFDLLAVQVTLKSLLQHHSSKASILWLVQQIIVYEFKINSKNKSNENQK